MNGATIVVAGDLRGHLIGTISKDAGTTAVADAEIGVHGRTPIDRWKRTTKSDGDGLFLVDLPFGTDGDVRITAVKGHERVEASIDSSDIARSLTPRPPAGSASRLSLEGEWDFATDPTNDRMTALETIEWDKITVPSHWEMAGFASNSGLALYRKNVEIPEAWRGRRVKLRSEGIYSRAEIWLNGQRQGSHDGGATPFELDITKAARIGQANVITVLVADRSDAGNLDAMSYYAHANLAGIWRPLELFCVEPVHLSRLNLVTEFDPLYRDADLVVDVDVVNERLDDALNISLALHIHDPAGQELVVAGLSAHLSLGPWARQHLTMRVRVNAPEQWNAERPRLYRLIVEVTAAGQESGTIEQTFGFRQVEIKGRRFLVNGRPVKLWGACRHDAHPFHGRAITSDIARTDVTLMKGANLNAFRTSHYPPHPAAIEFANEHGLYVEDEAPFCFVSVSYGPESGRKRNLADDRRLAPLAISLTSQLIERDRNHPSVIVWSQCNESKYGVLFALTREFIRTSDPTRPISAGQSANLDLATYHCPTTMRRLRETADFDVPVLFDEAFPIFQGMGAQADRLDLDPGLRDYWVTAHVEPLQALLKSEHQFGAMIWAWVDDVFLVPGKGVEYGRRDQPTLHFVDRVYDVPGRGIKGDPPFGIVDGWRRPRPEWWLCKKLFSPIQIDEQPLVLPRGAEPITVGVDNRNVFVNLREYRCIWRLAEETGEVRVDVAPMNRGTIEIAPNRTPSADDTLVLEFVDERGNAIDGARLSFRPPTAPVRSSPATPARIIAEPAELTFASIVRLVGSNAEIAFDRTSGTLIRGMAGRHQVLRRGLGLHIMNTAAPLQHDPLGWQLLQSDGVTRGDRAVLTWRGRYESGFTGGFEIQLDDDGNVEIAYSFAYEGPGVTAREIGLCLDLPLACDRLEWVRQAEWSEYPDDHIGRPHGVAKAHPSVAQTVPPGDRPFGLDDHPWGANDFRSTKRHIRWVSLTNPRGAGIKVIASGTQHVRATVMVHTISLKVLDSYGGTGTGRDEWDGASYVGDRILKHGDIAKGVVHLQLLDGSTDARSP